MLDIRRITTHPQAVIQQLTQRGFPNAAQAVHTLCQLNQERKKRQTQTDALNHHFKQHSQQIGQWMQQGKHEQIDLLRKTISQEKHRQKQAQNQLKALQQQLTDLLVTLPNLPHPTVPIGPNASHNKVIANWSPHATTQPTDPSSLLPHWDLMTKYDIIDLAQGSKITGAGFPIYKKQGAALLRGLIQWCIQKALQAGYQEKSLPLLVNSDSAFATGQLPDKEAMMYTLPHHHLYLIPTAEVPLTNLYRKVTLTPEKLPLKEVAYTPCFRTEAGSWGTEVRGLNRLHQFDKVELVQITTSGNPLDTLQALCDHVAHLLQQLELPYRQLQLCTGDLGHTAAITYDFEVWSPGQQKWLEVSSASYFETYQSRRMQLRYMNQGELHHCYTFNASALAMPRIIAALLEKNQTPTSIPLPTVLHPYIQFQAITNNPSP